MAGVAGTDGGQSTGERQAGDAARKHDDAGQGGAVHRLRRRGAAGQGGHHRHRRHRLGRAARGQHRRRDREHDPEAERPPRHVRRVDHVTGSPLQRRHGSEPGGEAEHRPGERGGPADNQSARDQDQAQVAFGGADRAEHAEGAQPALGHDREAGYRDQADEHQAEDLHHQHEHRRRDPARRDRGGGHDRRRGRDTGQRRIAVADRLPDGAGAEQHDHLAGLADLARGDQRELVRQVARVLHDARHPPGRPAAGQAPPTCAGTGPRPGWSARPDRAGRVSAADQAEQRRVVVPMRILGPERHGLGGASG